ncbi:MBL fold metallo-hydrolase [Fimbriiglobus ruber]|uniref:Zn-dependent hydrolases of the metallo-beta-lactamase superfamily n=1 Tax=Fimbriiglobus ruber TaxID=1908690 RepID=A0A225DS42_9BACT|nr:MBL fold metallo-hydrolase [Fimbriiglobus ruber]OWK40416.1 Zn-dependent hydrolases of the metallo-beta-lactamase superfamily [Fimbriiglobus ruber]
MLSVSLRAFFASATLFLTVGSVAAQDSEKKFIVRWFGQSFFQVETPSGKKIVFDPHAIPEFGRLQVPADIVVCSHLHNDHTQLASVENAKSARVFMGLEEGKKGRPPEWNRIDEKVGRIRVRTVPLFHDQEDGMTRGKNSAFVIDAEGMTFCHLGDVAHELTPGQVKAIGPVDVLMVPVGGIFTLNGERAKKVVDQIKPKLYVLPMHYRLPGVDELLSADEFLDEQPNVKRMPTTNELVIPADMKAATYTIVVLNWKKDEAAAPKK